MMEISEDQWATCWLDTLGLGIEQKYYDANGVHTRCIEAGEGLPLILVHGTGGHAETYMRNFGELGKHFRVYSLDMIGHGFTDKPDIDYTLPVYSQHLLDFMNAAGIEKAHIQGESLGAWIVAWFALEHPERVDKLVLNTAGGFRSSPEVMKKVHDSTLDAVMNVSTDSVRKRMEWLMYDKSLMTDEMVEIRRRIYAQDGMVEATRHVLCLQNMEVREEYILTPERLGSIQQETLVLWTSHDPTAPVEVGERAAGHIPGAKFVVIQDCGHWPQFEKPEEFHKVMLEFLTPGI